MMRAMTKDEFLSKAPETLATVGEDALVVREGQRFVAALIGERDFEAIRRVRGERAIAAMNRVSDAIEASGATEEELRELEKALDRHS